MYIYIYPCTFVYNSLTRDAFQCPILTYLRPALRLSASHAMQTLPSPCHHDT